MLQKFIVLSLFLSISFDAESKINRQDERVARTLYDVIKGKSKLPVNKKLKSKIFQAELQSAQSYKPSKDLFSCIQKNSNEYGKLQKLVRKAINRECADYCLKHNCFKVHQIVDLLNSKESFFQSSLDKFFVTIQREYNPENNAHLKLFNKMPIDWQKKLEPSKFSNIINNSDSRYFKTEFKHLLASVNSSTEDLVEQRIQEMISFVFNNYKDLDQDYTFDRLISLARKLTVTNTIQNSASIYTFLYTLEPTKFDTITSNLLWSLMFSGKDTVAQKFITEKNLSNTKIDSNQLSFWKSYILKLSESSYNLPDTEETKINFYSLIKHYLFEKNIHLPKTNSVDIKSLLKNSHFKNKTARYKIFAKLSLESFAYSEILELLNSYNCKNNSDGCNQFIINLFENIEYPSEYLSLFKVSYNLLDSGVISPNNSLLKQLFPMKYQTLINKNSKSVDPYLVMALSRQESSFNPGTISHAGAIGLMQIMPNTAKSMVKTKNIKKKLKNPSFNIKYGIKYLEKLLHRFDGDYVKAIAAYNAGPHRVDTWSSTVFSNKDPLLNIEAIPFEETRNYVKLVLRNFVIYKYLYNPNFKIEDEIAIVLPNLKR